MNVNKIKAKMRTGEKAYGCRLLFPSATLIELMGLAGFDYVFLDGEHGIFTLENIEEMCRVADQVGLTPIARVPDIKASTILQFLDRGIMGIMGPHIITKDDAQALVEACFFVPKGTRSFGSGRGSEHGVHTPGEVRRTFMTQVNEEIMTIALIEDAQALGNLSEILTVKHIDLFAFGPNDLAQSMGLPGEPNHPQVVEAIQQATDQIRAAGKKVRSDVILEARTNQLFLESAKEFLKNTRRKEV
jgi:2-keto-3-deoxy-L-rhamnonate aldolase RhmA